MDRVQVLGRRVCIHLVAQHFAHRLYYGALFHRTSGSSWEKGSVQEVVPRGDKSNIHFVTAEQNLLVLVAWGF